MSADLPEGLRAAPPRPDALAVPYVRKAWSRTLPTVGGTVVALALSPFVYDSFTSRGMSAKSALLALALIDGFLVLLPTVILFFVIVSIKQLVLRGAYVEAKVLAVRATRKTQMLELAFEDSGHEVRARVPLRNERDPSLTEGTAIAVLYDGAHRRVAIVTPKLGLVLGSVISS